MLCGLHRHGVSRVDVRHAGGDHEVLGVLEEQPGEHEGVAPHGLRYPNGPIAELLCLLGKFDTGWIIVGIQPGPDADFCDIGFTHSESLFVVDFHCPCVSAWTYNAEQCLW